MGRAHRLGAGRPGSFRWSQCSWSPPATFDHGLGLMGEEDDAAVVRPAEDDEVHRVVHVEGDATAKGVIESAVDEVAPWSERIAQGGGGPYSLARGDGAFLLISHTGREAVLEDADTVGVGDEQADVQPRYVVQRFDF